jgi:hypothetical protein
MIMIFLFMTVMRQCNNNNNNNLQISIRLSDTADGGFIRTGHVWGLVWTKMLGSLTL